MIYRLHYLFTKYNVRFCCKDESTFLATIEKNGFGSLDTMYLDPPYIGVQFGQYTQSGFSLSEHNHLFSCCRNTRIPRLIMSNSDSKYVYKNFRSCPGYSIRRLKVRHTINSKHPETIANEVLVVKS
mmetsp:Transcript_16055/g.18165  ORF Transcript_16055/g.18165 Transcript_16055/m.18165 type:complete len:127 (-) Transcript_16055:421-801(-)